MEYRNLPEGTIMGIEKSGSFMGVAYNKGECWRVTRCFNGYVYECEHADGRKANICANSKDKYGLECAPIVVVAPPEMSDNYQIY